MTHGFDGLPCALCALDYPTETLECLHPGHIFCERGVVFLYPCPVRYAQLPDAVFLAPGLPVLPIPVAPPW